MPILGVIASSTRQGQATDTGSMFPISVFVVPSAGVANVEFTSIPQTYTHLQIRGIARQSGGTDTQNYMRFNSDTASNYSTHALYGYGTGTGALGTANASYMSVMGTTSAGTNVFSGLVLDILDYKDTNKYKTIRALSGNDINGGGYIWFNSGNWRSNSAITTITLYNNGSNNFVQYSHFALYGIKA